MTISLDTMPDEQAVSILSSVVKGRRLVDAAPSLDAAEVQNALARHFGVLDEAVVPAPSDLARQALRVLAEDPDTQTAIEALAQSTAPESFVVLETLGVAAVVTLCLSVLATRVRYEKDKDGKVGFLIEKKALSDATLKKFIEMIQRIELK